MQTNVKLLFVKTTAGNWYVNAGDEYEDLIFKFNNGSVFASWLTSKCSSNICYLSLASYQDKEYKEVPHFNNQNIIEKSLIDYSDFINNIFNYRTTIGYPIYYKFE